MGYESVNPLIIYYPNTAPPLTTISGATVTDLGSPSAYNTAIFQGVNALVATGTDFAGPNYQVTATNEVFRLDSDPFTFEFWCRVGTSLPSNGASFVQVSLGNSNYSEQIGFDLFHEFNFQKLKLVQDNSVKTDITPDSSSITNLNHVAIQRHSALAYTLHYKGAVVTSWNHNQNFLFASGIRLEFAALSDNVPGTGMSQIRLTKEALYGTGAFTPPAAPFFTP